VHTRQPHSSTLSLCPQFGFNARVSLTCEVEQHLADLLWRLRPDAGVSGMWTRSCLTGLAKACELPVAGMVLNRTVAVSWLWGQRRNAGLHSGSRKSHVHLRPRCDWSDRRTTPLKRSLDLVPATASATFFPCELRSHSSRAKKVASGRLPLRSSPWRGAGRSPPVHRPPSRSR
jgi:hypothetical protein